jgi:hypothetical protein
VWRSMCGVTSSRSSFAASKKKALADVYARLPELHEADKGAKLRPSTLAWYAELPTVCPTKYRQG